MMRSVTVRTETSRYEVVAGEGILASALSNLARCFGGAEKAAVVTDEGVPPGLVAQASEALRQANLMTSVVRVASGEAAKSLRCVEDVLKRFASAGLHRRDLVVAVGGGVVTDLGGFCASIYMRGVRYINVATTLIGMVDAAVGGKTAVNLDSIKNLVGSFHQPSGVVCDVSALYELPPRELRVGLAEVLKYGFISRPDLLQRARAVSALIDARSKEAAEKPAEGLRTQGAAELVELVADCVASKAEIVSADEKEQGLREVLNFGHTLGHALEAATENTMSHGEAVAVGMAFEAELSWLLGHADLRAEVRSTLRSYDLPISVSGVDVSREAVLEAMKLDKKYRKGLRFVLLDDVGKPTVQNVVDEEAIAKALEAVGVV